MNFFDSLSLNSAQAVSEFGKEEKKKQEKELKKEKILSDIEHHSKLQTEELIKQNERLKMQHEQETRNQKKQKIWNWITFIIATTISVVALIVSILK